MPNPVPENRVGLALLIIGGFSLFVYFLNSYATRSTDLFACVVILALLGLGWYLRARFKGWGAPPRPPAAPKPAAPKPAAPAPKGGFPAPFGKRKGLAPPPRPAVPPGPPAATKPKGPFGPGKK